MKGKTINETSVIRSKRTLKNKILANYWVHILPCFFITIVKVIENKTAGNQKKMKNKPRRDKSWHLPFSL